MLQVIDLYDGLEATDMTWNPWKQSGSMNDMAVQFITFNPDLVGTAHIIQVLQGMAPKLDAVALAAVRRRDQKHTDESVGLAKAHTDKAADRNSLQAAHPQP